MSSSPGAPRWCVPSPADQLETKQSVLEHDQELLADDVDGVFHWTWDPASIYPTALKTGEFVSTLEARTNNNYFPILSSMALKGRWAWILEVHRDCSVGVCRPEIPRDDWIGHSTYGHSHGYGPDCLRIHDAWFVTNSRSIESQVSNENFCKFTTYTTQPTGKMHLLKFDEAAGTLDVGELDRDDPQALNFIGDPHHFENIPTGETPIFACCGMNDSGARVRIIATFPMTIAKSANKR